MPPWMIIPSAVSVTSAPMADKFFTMTSRRLDSLTFNSAASLIMVVPSAKQAITAIMGSSSIRVGMMAPSMTVPWRLLLFTRMSAVGSPEASCSFIRVMSAPMARQTRRIPSLVGLIPTCRISTSEPGTSRPAARNGAADEISPGTVICLP